MTDSDVTTNLLTELGIDPDSARPADEDAVSEAMAAYGAPEAPVGTPLGAPPHFTVQRMVLASLVEQAMLVVPTKSHYPPLQNLRLVVGDGRLAITGSDSTSTVISASTAVRVTAPGEVLIQAAKFATIIRRANGMEVEVRAEDTTLHITSGGASWSVQVSGSMAYPPVPELGDIEWHTVSSVAFGRAVDGSLYAAGTDEAKDQYVQLDFVASTVMATDSRRFARVQTDLPEDLEITVPVSGVNLLTRMLDRNDVAEFRIARVQMDEFYYVVAEIGPLEAPDRMIVTGLTSVFPPDARTAINRPLAENRDVLTVDGSTLIEAIRRATPTSDDETSTVALRVGIPDATKLTVASRNRYGDLSNEVIEVVWARPGTDTVPAARTIVVQYDFLIKAIRAALLVPPLAEDDEQPITGSVRLILGESRGQGKLAHVVVTDAAPGADVGAVLACLPQSRSDWLS